MKIITDQPTGDVVCMGKQASRSVVGNRVVFEFDINQVININYLPIIAGKFEVVRLKLKDGTIMKLMCQSKNMSYRVQNTESDHISFFTRLLDFEMDVLKLQNSTKEEFQWVYLDTVDNYTIKDTISNNFVYRGDCLFFYKTVILDCGIVVDKKSLDTYAFSQSEIILRFLYTLLLEKIAVKSLNDYWIFTGLA